MVKEHVIGVYGPGELPKRTLFPLLDDYLETIDEDVTFILAFDDLARDGMRLVQTYAQKRDIEMEVLHNSGVKEFSDEGVTRVVKAASARSMLINELKNRNGELFFLWDDEHEIDLEDVFEEAAASDIASKDLCAGLMELEFEDDDERPNLTLVKGGGEEGVDVVEATEPQVTHPQWSPDDLEAMSRDELLMAAEQVGLEIKKGEWKNKIIEKIKKRVGTIEHEWGLKETEDIPAEQVEAELGEPESEETPEKMEDPDEALKTWSTGFEHGTLTTSAVPSSTIVYNTANKAKDVHIQVSVNINFSDAPEEEIINLVKKIKEL